MEANLQPMNLGLVTAKRRAGPIGLAETRGYGYVFSDTLLKKKKKLYKTQKDHLFLYCIFKLLISEPQV